MSDEVKNLRAFTVDAGDHLYHPAECMAGADALEQSQFACKHNAIYSAELDDARKQGLQRIEKLEAALREIVSRTPANGFKVWPPHHWYLVTAENALGSAGDSALCNHKPSVFDTVFCVKCGETVGESGS